MKTNIRQNFFPPGKCNALMLCKQSNSKGDELKDKGDFGIQSWELFAHWGESSSVCDQLSLSRNLGNWCSMAL